MDELNALYKNRSMPYEQYFGEMELTEKQKEDRTNLAKDIEDLLLYIFALIGIMSEYNGVPDFYEIQSEIETRYAVILSKYSSLDGYLQNYIDVFSGNFVESTVANIKNAWFLSNDRARFIAENEANATQNYMDFVNAIKSGKTKKRWIDKKDKRERETHLRVRKDIVPITELFVVGDSLMRFPKDIEYAGDFPEEIVNCRCTIKYIK